MAASGASTNPVVQSIQLQLNQADVEIASLNGEITQHRNKAAELNGEIAKGGDPSETRRKARTAWTLEELFNYFRDTHAKAHTKPRT